MSTSARETMAFENLIDLGRIRCSGIKRFPRVPDIGTLGWGRPWLWA